jgi:hypothetical protein
VNNAILIALLSSSIWGVLNAIVAGVIVRRRTDAERKKLASESDKIDQEAEDRIYARLRENLADALERATRAENHADEAVAKSNRNGFLLYQLVDLIQGHRPWDVRIYELLVKHSPEIASEVGPPPDLNPYEILAAHSMNEPRPPKDAAP